MIDVQTLVVALEADARPAVQSAMRRLADTGDTRSPAGLATLLCEAVRVLLAHEPSFTHAWVESTSPLSPELARARFTEAAQRARARFEVEVIRNADGTTTRRAPPELAPTDGEPGVVLVTLVLARTTEIPDLVPHPDRAALRAALEDVARTTPDALVAMEVIWSPAEDRDRVSAAALEKRHPEIRRLASAPPDRPRLA